LPELALTEGNQQVAMKPDESLSPSFFIQLSFAFCRHSPPLVLRIYDGASPEETTRNFSASNKY
jgi:hypothetical protein